MKKKNFLKLPEFPGGKEEFQRYILDNLEYPVEALEKRVEGVVHLSAYVDDNGNVIDIHVEKGIGSGCDAEAVRLIEGIHFGKVSNRGVRVKTRKKFRVEFRIKETKQKNPDSIFNLQYSYKKSELKKKSAENIPVVSGEERKFSYSIHWNAD